jgi:hypothetical protein
LDRLNLSLKEDLVLRGNGDIPALNCNLRRPMNPMLRKSFRTKSTGPTK